MVYYPKKCFYRGQKPIACVNSPGKDGYVHSAKLLLVDLSLSLFFWQQLLLLVDHVLCRKSGRPTYVAHYVLTQLKPEIDRRPPTCLSRVLLWHVRAFNPPPPSLCERTIKLIERKFLLMHARTHVQLIRSRLQFKSRVSLAIDRSPLMLCTLRFCLVVV
jgi:hypothetical protein